MAVSPRKARSIDHLVLPVTTLELARERLGQLGFIVYQLDLQLVQQGFPQYRRRQVLSLYLVVHTFQPGAAGGMLHDVDQQALEQRVIGGGVGEAGVFHRTFVDSCICVFVL